MSDLEKKREEHIILLVRRAFDNIRDGLPVSHARKGRPIGAPNKPKKKPPLKFEDI